MAIQRNEIPILEFDDDKNAVIQPEHEGLDMRLPEKAVFAFLGDWVDRYAREHQAVLAGEFQCITKTFPVYVTEYRGEAVCLCQAPLGSAAAAQLMDWLIGYGVRKIIAAGSCGALMPLPENAFLLPVRALRDEGTSYHYLKPARYVELEQEVIRSMERTLEKLGLPYETCTTWSTDGFFRETREKVAYRRAEGCAVVEMECAALAACARMRGVKFGQILYTADSLANMDDYDARNWGSDSMEKALLLCLELVRELE